MTVKPITRTRTRRRAGRSDPLCGGAELERGRGLELPLVGASGLCPAAIGACGRQLYAFLVLRVADFFLVSAGTGLGAAVAFLGLSVVRGSALRTAGLSWAAALGSLLLPR